MLLGDEKGMSNVVGMNKCYPLFPHSNPVTRPRVKDINKGHLYDAVGAKY